MSGSSIGGVGVGGVGTGGADGPSGFTDHVGAYCWDTTFGGVLATGAGLVCVGVFEDVACALVAVVSATAIGDILAHSSGCCGGCVHRALMLGSHADDLDGSHPMYDVIHAAFAGDRRQRMDICSLSIHISDTVCLHAPGWCFYELTCVSRHFVPSVVRRRNTHLLSMGNARSCSDTSPLMVGPRGYRRTACLGSNI